jgi:uncharacterized membrane protein
MATKHAHPRHTNGKKILTQQQEFEVMKLVLDKFLWLGFGVMAYGFYKLATGYMINVMSNLAFVLVGAVVLALFVFILIREYEFMK